MLTYVEIERREVQKQGDLGIYVEKRDIGRQRHTHRDETDIKRQDRLRYRHIETMEIEVETREMMVIDSYDGEKRDMDKNTFKDQRKIEKDIATKKTKQREDGSPHANLS